MSAPGLMMAAGGVQAGGDIYSSQASAAAAGYNAKIAGQNAQLATQNAQWEGAIGESNVGQAGLKAQQEEGKVIVNEAANNVDVNSGSAKMVQKTSAEMSMLNEMNIRSNAARQAYGFETKAAGDVAQANLDRAEQSRDKTAGYVEAATSILGSAARADQYASQVTQPQSFGKWDSNPNGND